MTSLRVRDYGTEGPLVFLLHGGPGAPGHMAPVARGLRDAFRVREPFQRRSGGEPLTVAAHVEDLHDLVAAAGESAPPAIVGASWGAMLALAYAAAHPDAAGPLVLIGCGTFDLAARARMKETIEARLTPDLRRRLEEAEALPDADARLAAVGKLIEPLYTVDGVEDPHDDDGPFDDRGHRETWEDMIRLQAEEVYPAAFAAIRSPVLMLHGAFDPHPGRMIRDGLRPLLPGLEYVEWERCGHYPWRERAVRDEFFRVLREWLARHS